MTEPTVGEGELLDRQALRRVGGLSTELEDVSEVEYRRVRLERVLLVGVWTSGTLSQAERSLRELAQLAETAGSAVVGGVVQRRNAPDPATYVGSGKANELRDLVQSSGADTVICDGELSPGQLRTLEDIVKVKVVDRTWLILDIFAQHARSREGRRRSVWRRCSTCCPVSGDGASLCRGRRADAPVEPPVAWERADQARQRSRRIVAGFGRRWPRSERNCAPWIAPERPNATRVRGRVFRWSPWPVTPTPGSPVC